MIFASLSACVLYLLHSNGSYAALVKNLTALNTEIAPSWVMSAEREIYDFLMLLYCYTSAYPSGRIRVPILVAEDKTGLHCHSGAEIIVLTAFEQWILARKFLKELNLFLEEHKDQKYQVQILQYRPVTLSDPKLGLEE